jgi:hypothetical protein
MANNLFFWEESSAAHRYRISSTCNYHEARLRASGQWITPARLGNANGLVGYQQIEAGQTVTLTMEGCMSLSGALTNRMRGVVSSCLPKGFRFATFGDYLEDDVVLHTANDRMIQRASWFRTDEWRFSAGNASDCVVFLPLSSSTFLPEIVVFNPTAHTIDMSALWDIWHPNVVDYELGLELLSAGHELTNPVLRSISGNPKNSDSVFVVDMLGLLCEDMCRNGRTIDDVVDQLSDYFDMEGGYSIRAFYAETFGDGKYRGDLGRRSRVLNDAIRFEERGRGLDENFEALPQYVEEAPEIIDEVVSDTPTVEIGDADSESDKENEKEVN